MNCRRFQKQLFEYVEGSLPPRQRAAAEEHLAQCGSCRAAVQQEQQVARSLSRWFNKSAGQITLRPEAKRRILAALERPPVPERESDFSFWSRFAWPLATAACLVAVLMLLGKHSPSERNSTDEFVSYSDQIGPETMSVHVSYRVPIYTFRNEGGQVLDSLTYATNVVDSIF